MRYVPKVTWKLRFICELCRASNHSWSTIEGFSEEHPCPEKEEEEKAKTFYCSSNQKGPCQIVLICIWTLSAIPDWILDH